MSEELNRAICIHCRTAMKPVRRTRRIRQILTCLAMLIPLFTALWAFGYLSDKNPPVITTTGLVQTILLGVISISLLILVLRGLKTRAIQACPECGYFFEVQFPPE